jgi:hypothetical protein
MYVTTTTLTRGAVLECTLGDISRTKASERGTRLANHAMRLRLAQFWRATLYHVGQAT